MRIERYNAGIKINMSVSFRACPYKMRIERLLLAVVGFVLGILSERVLIK